MSSVRRPCPRTLPRSMQPSRRGSRRLMAEAAAAEDARDAFHTVAPASAAPGPYEERRDVQRGYGVERDIVRP